MNFDHFIAAQDPIYPQVLRELRAGHKTSHWMWFIFPQLAGLGSSEMSQRYSLDTLETARHYLHHPILGPRLLECTHILLQTQNHTAEQIFGPIDSLKLRSSLTLFCLAAPAEPAFSAALKKFFQNQKDLKTLTLLNLNDPS